MASEGYHEPIELLDGATLDMHRALTSLTEELEAVDWYHQRIVATDDDDLAEILAHNRDEEKEHAAMTLEWVRRRDPAFDTMLREFLFTDGSVAHTVAQADAGARSPGGSGSLGLGSLRGTA